MRDKITKMAQLREALQQGGHIVKYSYGNGAEWHPEGFRGYGASNNKVWPVDVSLVAFNALLNRGELRRLDTYTGYRSSGWVLKTTGYTMVEAEAKINTAKAKLEAANRVLAEAQAARDLAATEWTNAFNELSKVGEEVSNEDQ